MILGMDWLYLHRTNVDFYDKAIECLNDNEKNIILQGKNKYTLVRMVTTMQGKRNCRRGCVTFAIHISSEKGMDGE